MLERYKLYEYYYNFSIKANRNRPTNNKRTTTFKTKPHYSEIEMEPKRIDKKIESFYLFKRKLIIIFDKALEVWIIIINDKKVATWGTTRTLLNARLLQHQVK